MNITTITIETDADVKVKAQKVAKELGISLTAVINRYLKYFVKTKSVTLSTDDETPNKYLQGIMKKAEKNRREGKTSPIFDNGKDAIKWLEQQGI